MNIEQEYDNDIFEDTIIKTSKELRKACVISGLYSLVNNLPYINTSLKEILIKDFILNKKYEKVIIENVDNIINNIILSSKR